MKELGFLCLPEKIEVGGGGRVVGTVKVADLHGLFIGVNIVLPGSVCQGEGNRQNLPVVVCGHSCLQKSKCSEKIRTLDILLTFQNVTTFCF